MIETRQAEAWFARTHPADYARWDRAVLIADLSDDGETYDRLHRETVTLWREHRDDPLPVEEHRTVELAQAIAWLGDRHDAAWVRANVLTVDAAEHERDEETLIRSWRAHRDEPELPGRVVGYVSSLARAREARFEQATNWHRLHDPAGHTEWSRRRDYADTIGDEWADDGRLLRHWYTQHPAATRRTPETPTRDAAQTGTSRTVRQTAGASPFATPELDAGHGPARSL